MKSGLIVQTSVGMRNVLAKKTLRSDAQPLSNRVATRMCGFDRPRQRRGAHDARAPGAGSIWDRRVRDRAVRHDRAPSSRARRSGLRLPVTGVRPTPLSQRRGPGPLPGPWNRLCPVGSRTRSRGRPERVRPSTDGGRRQPGFPASCPTPVPRDGRLGLTVVRRYLVVTCLLRPAAAHPWPTLLPPYRYGTAPTSWSSCRPTSPGTGCTRAPSAVRGGSAGSSPPVISRLRHGQPPRGDPPGQGGPARRTALSRRRRPASTETVVVPG